jgi:hypothetical protein
MKAFIAQCEKANENWRRVAYKWLIDNGLYVGSAIKVKERTWKGDGKEYVALITSISLRECRKELFYIHLSSQDDLQCDPA